MAATLTFSADEVRVILNHTRNAKSWIPSFEMTQDPKYLKPGVVVEPGRYAKHDQLDLTKVPPSLQLVKDTGAYLISGSSETLPSKSGSGQYAAYALGFGPDCDYDKLRNALGGDDFVENLPLDAFAEALDAGATLIYLRVTANRIAISSNAPSASQQARQRPSHDAKLLAEIRKVLGVTGKSKWAEAGKRHSGKIVATDTNVLYQLVGEGLVAHEKALLPTPRPRRESVVSITYPADPNGIATVTPYKPRKATKASG